MSEKIDRSAVNKARQELMDRVESELPHVRHSFAHHAGTKRTREKYGSLPDRLAPEDWGTLTFIPRGNDQAREVYDLARTLIAEGFRFDTGGGCCGLDWELDWSFRKDV